MVLWVVLLVDAEQALCGCWQAGAVVAPLGRFPSCARGCGEAGGKWGGTGAGRNLGGEGGDCGFKGSLSAKTYQLDILSC